MTCRRRSGECRTLLPPILSEAQFVGSWGIFKEQTKILEKPSAYSGLLRWPRREATGTFYFSQCDAAAQGRLHRSVCDPSRRPRLQTRALALAFLAVAKSRGPYRTGRADV